MFKKIVLLSFFLVFALSMVYGDEAAIQRLREQGEREGWTFAVGQTPVSDIPLEQLCGLVIPDNWRERGIYKEDIYRNMVLASPPASYDLRTQGLVTPVKNQNIGQKECGSCWAFAIIGSYESAILFHGGPSVDLSEQWLLDCNSYGYDCLGGFFDAGYDLDGGVQLESCYPYEAEKSYCKEFNCNKYFPLISWTFIAGPMGLPSNNALKQAIYDHGGIAAAVTANDAMQNYTGGIFNACSSASPNHAIVLVGWDDEAGIWIFKNSWGTGWGENAGWGDPEIKGYCRILYNCSKIGTSACYVIPTPEDPPSKPILVSPANGAVIVTTTPTLTWSAVTADPAVDNYRLYIYLNGTRIYNADTGTSTSHEVPSGTLLDGNEYDWKVRDHNSLGGWSVWSDIRSFTVDLESGLPPKPVLLSPANGATVTTTPTLTWSAVTADPAVNNYHLQIFLQDTGDLVYSASTGTSTSHTVPSGELTAGNTYKWKVRAHNAVGWGSWSDIRIFTVEGELPPQPVLVSPANGATVTTTPTLSWHAVTADPAVNNYHLQIFLLDTGDLVYSASTGTSTSHTVPSGELTVGNNYKWKVRAHNAVGWSSWSDIRTFTTQ